VDVTNITYRPILVSSVSVALNQYGRFLFLPSSKTTRVYMAVIYILYVVNLKLWLRSDSVLKSSSLRHSNCLASIALILDIYL